MRITTRITPIYIITRSTTTKWKIIYTTWFSCIRWNNFSLTSLLWRSLFYLIASISFYFRSTRIPLIIPRSTRWFYCCAFFTRWTLPIKTSRTRWCTWGTLWNFRYFFVTSWSRLSPTILCSAAIIFCTYRTYSCTTPTCITVKVIARWATIFYSSIWIFWTFTTTRTSHHTFNIFVFCVITLA